MLGFETITFAPIAQNLVEVALLSGAEADWLDAYHAEVLAKLGADMGGEERAWLEAACAPLDRTAHIRSEEHTSELQSLMRISYARFCLKKKTTRKMPLVLALSHPKSNVVLIMRVPKPKTNY